MPTVELEVFDFNARDTLAIEDACTMEEIVISRTRASTRPSLLSPVLTLLLPLWWQHKWLSAVHCLVRRSGADSGEGVSCEHTQCQQHVD